MDPLLLNLLTFFAGLLIGHRLNLGRDKRKEFNDVAQRIRSIFLSECANPNPNGPSVSHEDLDLFIQIMNPWKRKSFLKAMEDYNKAAQGVEFLKKGGYVSYTDAEVEAIKKAACNVLPYTRRI